MNDGDRVRGAHAVVPAPVEWFKPAEPHEYLVVDVFTLRPLEGNQLGVFLDGRALTSEEMLRLAREMNFAETVFLLPAATEGDAAIRIFTPGGELPFAGHPVLGTAFVVGTALGADSVVLETGAGPVPIALERDDGRIVFGRMQQPIPTWEPFAQEAELLSALGVESSELPVEVYRNGLAHVYVKLPSEQAVAEVRPDMARLAELGVGANCFAGKDQAWKTRMFFPATGVPEDAATGSAAGPLALHLARHGQIAFRQEIEIRQGEEINRPSRLYARVSGKPERIEAVEVGGGAEIVAHGQFRVR
jgi:trans-2,3-dihydro-3-hydroxyanthranilate isomerase